MDRFVMSTPADFSTSTEQVHYTNNHNTELEIDHTLSLPNTEVEPMDVDTDPDHITHNPLYNMADPLPRSVSPHWAQCLQGTLIQMLFAKL